MNDKKILLCLIILIICFLGTANGQLAYAATLKVEATVENTFAAPGQLVNVPIRLLNQNQEQPVSAIQFTLTYNRQLLTMAAEPIRGPLLEGANIITNPESFPNSSGKLIFIAFTTDENGFYKAGEDLLVSIPFQVKAGISEQEIPLTLTIKTATDIDSKKLVVNPKDGKITITIEYYGDVSGDGYVTAYDASLVLRYVVGLIELSLDAQEQADVTGDDTISALDAALILLYTVGLINKFPNLEPPSVQTATCTPDPAKAGTVTIAIQFKVNISDGMNNTIPPDVKIITAGDSETVTVAQSSYVGGNWTGTAEITDTMANGTATIKVSGATDNNGSVMEPNNNAGIFVIDTVAPTVLDVTVAPNPAKPGTITVSMIFTEATSGLNINVSPLVTFTPIGATTSIPVTQSEYVQATRTWTGTATITEDMPNGEAVIKVSSVEDMAGNVMQPNNQAGTFIIDTIKIGDVNGDGAITPRDASLIMQHVVGSINLLEAPYNVPLEKVDVTGDGTISALDAALILQYIAGLIDKFPAHGKIR